MRFAILLFLMFCVFNTAWAQPPCAGPGRAAGSAQAVCGNLTFIEKDVSNCTGSGNLPNPTAGCGDIVTTDNSRWYKFHCYQAGTLGFLINPNSPLDDYDWEVMDITGRNPNDVYTMELRVSLNLSGQTGATGCTNMGSLDVHCGGGPAGSQFNRLMDLQTDHDYLMMVNNYSASNLPYSIDFFGTAVLSLNTPPTITNVSVLDCDRSKISVTFSEDILCSSITNSGSEFGNTIAGQLITGITSDCALPGANGVTSLIINLQTPIPPGSYQLNANTGTDADIFRNVCTLEMLPTSITFTVGPVIPLAIDAINYTGCAPTVLNVTLTKPVWCNSITASGSEFTIMPGNPAITSVQSSCGGSGLYTNQLQLVLQNPLPHGNYQLVVNNGTDANTFSDTCGILMATGTTFPFTIAQTTSAPLIQSFEYDNCKRDKLVVNFNKPIACGSLTANGSEFSFVPGGPVITGITSNCGTNSYTSQVTLLLASPMPPLQSVNIMIRNGTDGNTLSDTCFSFITQLYTAAFQAPAAPPLPVVDSVQYDKCGPYFIKVFYSRAILCSSISPDGSQFKFFPPGIPGPVTIVSATGDPATCSFGYSNWILVQFSAPITTSASYTLVHFPGSDGKAIKDTCNSVLEIFGSGNMIRLDVIKPAANFNSQVKWGCVMDTIVLSHPGGNGVNSWIWNFSDGTTATGQNVSHTFPVTTPTATVQLIVSNGTCIDSLTKIITLGNFFKAGFRNSPVDSFCVNTPVIFTDTSSGNISNYLWDFGDLTQFNGQNPPAHVYTVSNNYSIKLIVTDIYGCTDTARVNRYVTPAAFIDFTGLKPQYCTGNPVVLTRKISRFIQSYVWDNGDGKIFTNEVDVNFSYVAEGVYTITLSGTDRYCGTATVSKTVPVFAVPKVKLPADTVLCQNEQMLIGVLPNANYTYLWNTGANTSQIVTNIFTRDYTLTASNNGCSAYDAMHVKVLTACIIKVPNAFTPNRDGLNDQLKATNADLAKNFSLQIFNRNGQLVFFTNNPLQGWDGRFKGNPQQTGTYVWMLSYTDPWNGKFVKEKGSSILLR